MDANEYQLLKSSGEILDFATLKETERCLFEARHSQLAQSITRILVNNKIEKPVYHDKSEEQYTSYYRIDLSAEDIEIIVSMFGDKEVSALTANFEMTSLSSFYASMLDRWNDLII
ncbi:hypothetical protein [Hymenobacter negativus]|uniref:Uncharacterized protein n=1 Tax=Hymenobacter negativus TaxID=2795026 RepID=A0ABS3QAY5_9BACT|nr:hypothetical protein [Hymenobacter negativus]MBO2008420.1 hypothetical protein [Hymenobacter negativus]